MGAQAGTSRFKQREGEAEKAYNELGEGDRDWGGKERESGRRWRKYKMCWERETETGETETQREREREGVEEA